MPKKYILTSSTGLPASDMWAFRASVQENIPGAIIIDVVKCSHPPVVGRIEKWVDILENLPDDSAVMLADGRDQIFQSDPFASYPSGLHVFEEDNRMTMGRCPYNGKWGRDRYGDAYLESVKDRNILCVGTVIGDLPEVRNLVRKMHIEIGNHPRYGGLEQAVFQYLILTGKVEAEVHSNEESDVYTVGYIPRETVRADERGVIYNLAGSAPAAIHQYDRHENLKKVVASRWPYPSTK